MQLLTDHRPTDVRGSTAMSSEDEAERSSDDSDYVYDTDEETEGIRQRAIEENDRYLKGQTMRNNIVALLSYPISKLSIRVDTVVSCWRLTRTRSRISTITC